MSTPILIFFLLATFPKYLVLFYEQFVARYRIPTSNEYRKACLSFYSKTRGNLNSINKKIPPIWEDFTDKSLLNRVVILSLNMLLNPFMNFPMTNLFGPVIIITMTKTFCPTKTVAMFTIPEAKVVGQGNVLTNDWS